MIAWVRLWHDMPTDPKWRVIARKSGQPIPCVIAVFNLLLINASQNAERRGVMENFDSEDAAAALDMLPEDVDAILSAMQGKVLDGKKLTGWEKRQPKREDTGSSDRVKAYREREKAKRSAAKRNVTHGNAPETDADAEQNLEPNGSCASGDALTPEHVVEHWNELAPALGKPTIRKLTPERRALVKARIAQNNLADFVEVFANIRASPFLRGDTGWHGCTFDWVFKKGNFQKILEGNYNDQPA